MSKFIVAIIEFTVSNNSGITSVEVNNKKGIISKNKINNLPRRFNKREEADKFIEANFNGLKNRFSAWVIIKKLGESPSSNACELINVKFQNE